MLNAELLRDKINETGMTIVSISMKTGILRETLYNRMAGKSEFKASEIQALTRVLQLTRKERDEIFFGSNVN